MWRSIEVALSRVGALLLAVGVSAALAEPRSGIAGKPVVYQLFTRLFGNTETRNRPWGTRDENGVGRFADINDAALRGIRDLGVTHVWYTGVLHHASVTDYSEVGIPPDDPDVVKGRAGSPYAIRDYYAVDPDLAVVPARRLEEFRELVERSHRAGLKVIIDIVPNHVARRYQSLEKPPGVRDLGADDDRSVTYARDNDFYYVVGEDFRVPAFGPDEAPLGGEAHPGVDGHFVEQPAKWTGNGARSAQPAADDWYETVRINFGVRPDGSHDFPTLPAEFAGRSPAEHAAFWQGRDLPASWYKLRDIVHYWLGQGVDGFRYDMAEMVPVEFWSFLNASIRARHPDVLLIAEVYQPGLYRDYIDRGLMDYLYAKVDLYDTLVAVLRGERPVDAISDVHRRLADIDDHLLTFLENHDELRLANPALLGDPRRALPAMAVSALLWRGATLLYFAQEVGEAALGNPGYGPPGDTTIFDYWGVPAQQRWMNGGRFDGGALSDDERALRDDYRRILRTARDSPAVRGETLDLNAFNRGRADYPRGFYGFARIGDGQCLLVLANLSSTVAAGDVALPRSLQESCRHGEGWRVLGPATRERVAPEPPAALAVDLAPAQWRILVAP